MAAPTASDGAVDAPDLDRPPSGLGPLARPGRLAVVAVPPDLEFLLGILHIRLVVAKLLRPLRASSLVT